MKKRSNLFASTIFVLGLVTPAAAPAASAKTSDDALAPVVVTATRIGNREYELTGDVTVIGADQIESSGVRTVAEVLELVPGIHVYNLSTAKSSVADIRGFGDAASTNVLVLVNDRKLNSVDLSGPDLIQIPVEAIERVEVLRGAGSVLYGDNAVGGVINIITKEGRGEPRWTFVNQSGSYNRHKSSGQVSGQAGDLGYYAYGSYDDDKGYRDRSDVLAKNFNTRLTHKFGERVALDLEVGGHEDDTELPGGLDENELVRLGRRGAADDNDSTTRDVFARLGADVALGDDAGEWGHLVTDITYKDRDVFDSFFGTFNSDRRIDQWGALTKYVFNSELLGRDVDFVVGVDAYGTENDILGSGTNTDDITITKDEIGAYTFLEVEAVGGLYVNAGGRYQQAEYGFDDRGGRVELERDVDEWTGLFGLKYVVGPGTNVFASVQKTFRFLATDEWYSTFGGLNTNLDQQKGMQYELGLRQAVGRWGSLSVVPYRIELEDEIYFDPSTFSNGNYDETHREGIETYVTVDAMELFGWEKSVPTGDMASRRGLQRFEIGLGHTYQKPEFIGGPNDKNIIPLVPDHQFTHHLSVRAWENFQFVFRGRMTGERVIGNDIDNSKGRASAYYFADARFAYTLGAFELFVEVNNLFDELYNTYEIEKTAFGSPNVTRDVYPAPERNMNVGVKVKF
jgi:iron complex outermembrane receptor protein